MGILYTGIARAREISCLVAMLRKKIKIWTFENIR